MPIVPDDKSWTWVLERPCPDCGFDGSTFDPSEAPAVVLANAITWQRLLADPRVNIRPNDHQWSAVEYGCHVRDVYRLYLWRLHLMREEAGPHFPNWDQDQTAIDDRYDLQDPSTVAGELAAAADELAAAFAAVQPDQWDRTGFRSDGAAFTIDSFTRYMVHDPVHHVWDVESGYHEIDQAGRAVTDHLRTGRERPDDASMNSGRPPRTMSIAESIAAASEASYVPVTFESCEHAEGPFFHGTNTSFDAGDLLVAGQLSNYHEGRISNHVYFSALLEPAVWAAELAVALAASEERGRIYIVEPTGPFEDDPNVTNKRFPGNVTRSYRTRHPMIVIDEVQSWEGHPPEALRAMLDNIARLREQGLDVIEDE